MLKIDNLQVKEYENDLQKFKKRAYPFATKQTINNLAFETKKLSQETIKNKMITKNKFTANSIRVDKAKTLRLSRQESVVGSMVDYMEKQEFGFVKTKRGSTGVALATGYSSGQEGVNPRTKLPTRPNKMQNIQLQRKARKAKTRKQRNFIAIKQAAKSNKKYIYLHLEKTKGIFKITGGKKNPKIKMVYNLDRQSVRIPKNPWLFPSTMKANDRRQEFYNEALKFQLKRHNLFKG